MTDSKTIKNLKYIWPKWTSGSQLSNNANAWTNEACVLYATKLSNSSSKNPMCIKPKLQLSFAATFMDSFMMSLSCLRSEANCQGPGIFLLEILLIEGTILFRLLNSFSVTSSSIPKISSCSGEIISPGKLPLSTGFMIKSWKNMDAQPRGSTSIKPLIIFHSEHLSKTKFSAFMEAFLLKSRPLTKWEPLTEKWKSHTKVTFLVISGAFCDLMWSDP